jgi:hypothetical protein
MREEPWLTVFENKLLQGIGSRHIKNDIKQMGLNMKHGLE